jgi:hypothetical protein
MAFPSRKSIILAIFFLSTISVTSSCVRVRNPGIVPFIEDDPSGEWVVVSEEYSPPMPAGSDGRFRLTLIIEYIPGEAGRPIRDEELVVFFDEDPVPYVFNEVDQILETGISADFGPSFRHSLTVEPAGGRGSPFPSLTLSF